MSNNLYNSNFSIAETTANYKTLEEKYNNDSQTKEKLYGTLLVASRENDATSKDLLLCSDKMYNLSQPSINVQVPLQYAKSDINNKKILSIRYNQEQFNNGAKSELTLNDEYIKNMIVNLTDPIRNNMNDIIRSIEDIKTTLNKLSDRITALENKENVDNNENNNNTQNEIVEENNIE